MVQSHGFREFCYSMDPKYTVPTRRTMRKLIKSLDQKTKDSLKAELIESPWVAITSDLWTDRTTRAYLGLTVHFYDKDGDLKTATMSCETFHARETAENIAPHIQRILGEYEIEGKLVCGCTDDGGNMKKAFKDAGIPRIHCFAHCLNICVKDTFKVMESKEMELQHQFGYKALREKVSNLVTLMRRSVKAKNALDACQRRLKPNKKPYVLIKDVDTRWVCVVQFTYFVHYSTSYF